MGLVLINVVENTLILLLRNCLLRRTFKRCHQSLTGIQMTCESLVNLGGLKKKSILLILLLLRGTTLAMKVWAFELKK